MHKHLNNLLKQQALLFNCVLIVMKILNSCMGYPDKMKTAIVQGKFIAQFKNTLSALQCNLKAAAIASLFQPYELQQIMSCLIFDIREIIPCHHNDHLFKINLSLYSVAVFLRGGRLVPIVLFQIIALALNMELVRNKTIGSNWIDLKSS